MSRNNIESFKTAPRTFAANPLKKSYNFGFARKPVVINSSNFVPNTPIFSSRPQVSQNMV
jgi:hypothetical protein